MSGRDDGGAAFPAKFRLVPPARSGYPSYTIEGDDGMSIRDYAAIKFATALAGRLGYRPQSASQEVARDAYRLADAMLQERSK